MNTKTKILEYIKTNKQGRPHELTKNIKVTRALIHRKLKELVSENRLVKNGKSPLVFYTLSEKNETTIEKTFLPKEPLKVIEKYFVFITSTGKVLRGAEGFLSLASSKFPDTSPLVLSWQYLEEINKIAVLRTDMGLLDISEKLNTEFNQVFVDKLFVSDTYSLPKFGWTKYTNLISKVKQSSNKQLELEILNEAKKHILSLIKEYKIESIGFIPPSEPRKVQLINLLKKGLKITLPHLKLVKIYSKDVIVAQKSLLNTKERLENAKNSIFLRDRPEIIPHKILLIDDVIDSGASLNETAKKLKQAGIGKELIIGYGVVGNIKGYEAKV